MTGHILIVDDDTDTVMLMKYMLEGEGYAVSHANDASAAYRVVGERMPNLILLDLRLPGEEDGLAIARSLRAGTQTRHIPIVLFTANETLENRMESDEIGIEAFVSKPVRPKDMLVTIDALLRRGQG